MKDFLKKKITITADEFSKKCAEVSAKFVEELDKPELSLVLTIYSAELGAELFTEKKPPKSNKRYFQVKKEGYEYFNIDKGDIGELIFEDKNTCVLYNEKWKGIIGWAFRELKLEEKDKTGFYLFAKSELEEIERNFENDN